MPAKQNLIYVDAEGFHPETADLNYFLKYILDQAKEIYGDDTYLEPDTQDYQLAAMLAMAMLDTYRVAKAVYQSFSPVTSSGVALSNNVAINGIVRPPATASSVTLTLTGVSGTIITDGKARDIRGNIWEMSGSYRIGSSGTASVPATCATLGAVRAPKNTITTIVTPVLGWQSVTNDSAAVKGNAYVSDEKLRKKQQEVTEGPKTGTLSSIISGILKADDTDSIKRIRGFENPLDKTDSDGLPPHSFAIVVEGGNKVKIATEIARRKTIGTTTVGTTTVVVPDDSPYTGSVTVNYYAMTEVRIYIEISVKSTQRYDTSTDGAIKSAVLSYINSLAIHQDVEVSKIYAPADLANRPSLTDTFDIKGIKIGKVKSSLSTNPVAIAITEGARTNSDSITIKHL